WSRHRKLPRLAPLLMPPSDATIAVAVGRPTDPARYAKMSREEMLDDLRRMVREQMTRAEALRRKPYPEGV
ncbi:MAG TPA: hypothetical protein VKE40_10785, partial [Gemmataceae bacterium]|nr:hypothetical protein [Gemmataceae bacterium]